MFFSVKLCASSLHLRVPLTSCRVVRFVCSFLSAEKVMKRKNFVYIIIVVLAAICCTVRWRPGSGETIYADGQAANDSICNGETTFAAIGDYGEDGTAEEEVADRVKSWQPDYIFTLGDNNYGSGAEGTIDDNIGQYYGDYIYPYYGTYDSTATENRFFPSLGNHDWRAATDTNPYPQPYLDYFTLPGNERYYDVRRGPVHLFILDSAHQEEDGRTSDSIQAQWLAEQMAASNAPWKLVAMHEPPYSSGASHGSRSDMQWDYAEMGATAVLAGHDHLYERLERDDILYFVNGLGGRQEIDDFDAPLPSSVVRYN